jgi:hypothetical protein
MLTDVVAAISRRQAELLIIILTAALEPKVRQGVEKRPLVGLAR